MRLLILSLILLIFLLLGFKLGVIDESNQSVITNKDISGGENTSNLPRIVHHNFIELDKIARISKFRSGYGHDFSRGFNETDSCQSMKHYFMIKGVNETFWSHYNEGEVTSGEWPIVHYFAPVNGTIIDVRSAKNLFNETELQFILQADEDSRVWFLFFHVAASNISIGSHVLAGELLGAISPGNHGEIGVSVNSNTPEEQLVSFFQIIDDNTFSEYQERGVTNRGELIISSAERDKNPLICDDSDEKRFIGSKEIPDNESAYDAWSMSEANWVILN